MTTRAMVLAWDNLNTDINATMRQMIAVRERLHWPAYALYLDPEQARSPTPHAECLPRWLELAYLEGVGSRG
ncbi:hypothetical protein ABZ949_34105 [Micromonospora tulbaghiae]|uniref:hypothetical protein n=1 Tax=Micromonospora tulbaghiae TaxID=479978 RepID=UPI0033E518E9